MTEERALSAIYSYRDRINELFSKTNIEVLPSIGDLFYETTLSGKSIWVFGNGGSLSTAQHVVTDLGTGSFFKDKSRFLRIFNLLPNMSNLTALANDYTFDLSAAMHLETFCRPEDILFLISASGNSENLIRAAEFARQTDIRVVSLTGFDGGRLKSLSDFNIHVPSHSGEYGPVEDIHLSICHMLTNYLRIGDHRIL